MSAYDLFASVVLGLSVTAWVMVVVYFIRLKRALPVVNGYKQSLEFIVAMTKHHDVWPKLFQRYEAELLYSNLDGAVTTAALLDITKWHVFHYAKDVDALLMVRNTTIAFVNQFEIPASLKERYPNIMQFKKEGEYVEI